MEDQRRRPVPAVLSKSQSVLLSPQLTQQQVEEGMEEQKRPQNAPHYFSIQPKEGLAK